MVRTASTSLITAAILFIPRICHGQTSGPRPTYAEVAHHLAQTIRPEYANGLFCGDVALVLKYGSPEEAERLSRLVLNVPTHIVRANVLEARENWILVSSPDGNTPPFGVFRFEFKEPLSILPSPGQKITLSGTYSSYTRNPLLITMTNSSISLR